MSDAKATIFQRLHSALRDVPSSEVATDLPTLRQYRMVSQETGLLELAAERIAEYRATVHVTTALELAASIRACLEAHSIKRLVAPPQLPEAWTEGVAVIRDTADAPLGHADLERVDGVLTACAVVIAETGSLVLDHRPNQGRRALSLIPDYHLCVALESQIVDNLPAAMRVLQPAVQAGQPLTFISGPSATSDIELSRVEGVHGPRRLEVLLVRDEV